MKRRSFLKFLGLSALFHRWLLREASAAAEPVVAIAEGRDYARVTRNAIAAL